MIRVIVADGHPIVREGFKRLLTSSVDMALVAEAATGAEALRRAADSPADVLVLDRSIPGPGFLEIVARIRAKHPALGVLVLGTHSEDHSAVRALRAGARGCLSRSESVRELTTAIRRVGAGQRHISATLAEELAQALESDGELALHEQLSNREYQVLALLGAGLSVGAAAEQMRLSPKTVSTYRARVMQKLHLSGTAALIRYALEHRIAP